jgi:hypothetical protein
MINWHVAKDFHLKLVKLNERQKTDEFLAARQLAV